MVQNSTSIFTPDFVAICALIVAVLAMASTFWQAHIARKHNRLSVRPCFDWGRYAVPNKGAKLEIVNNGLGTGVIKSFSLIFDDVHYPITKIEVPPPIKKALSDASIKIEWLVSTPETPVKAGQSINLLKCSLSNQNDFENQEQVVKLINRIGVKIEYHSIYEERFVLICSPELNPVFTR
jgi:hypothetical protein